jgi:hypothetical protein
MANNIEGSNSKNTATSIHGGRGNAVANLLDNRLFASIIGGNNGGDSSGNNKSGGGGITAEQLEATIPYNQAVSDIYQQHAILGHTLDESAKTNQFTRDEAAKNTAHVRGQSEKSLHMDRTKDLLSHAAGLGQSVSTLGYGDVNLGFHHPGYGNGGQGGSQQQDGVKPTTKTKTAVDRAPAIHSLFDADKNHGGYMVEGDSTVFPGAEKPAAAPRAPRAPKASKNA